MRVLSIVHEREAGSGVFENAARVRDDELVEWIPAEAQVPTPGSFDAALVFGGAMHVDAELAHPWLAAEKHLLRALLGQRTPVLGVCLGAQLLAEVAGGAATPMPAAEIGWTPIELEPAAHEDPLLAALPGNVEAFQWHSYEVTLPPRATCLARSAACLQAFRLERAPCWGIQFHAEVTRETIAGWIDDYRSDPDAVRAQLDWTGLLAQTERQIGVWNDLGVGICRRFLDRARQLAAP